MHPFTRLTGVAIPLGLANVDTDVILPGRFLKTIVRTGLGRHAFETIRAGPDNVFDQPRYAAAPVLIAGDNFGCGSSREHAPWALLDMGIRVIIAPSFADIFSGNAFKNGLLLVPLPRDQVDRLLVAAETEALSVDLAAQSVSLPDGEMFAFAIDPFRKECLLNGLDEIALTETFEPQIAAYEAALAIRRPWIAHSASHPLPSSSAQ